jgi:hypothetical protein
MAFRRARDGRLWGATVVALLGIAAPAAAGVRPVLDVTIVKSENFDFLFDRPNARYFESEALCPAGTYPTGGGGDAGGLELLGSWRSFQVQGRRVRQSWNLFVRHGLITPPGAWRASAVAMCLGGRGLRVGGTFRSQPHGDATARHSGTRRLEVLAVSGRAAIAQPGQEVTARAMCPRGTAVTGGGVLRGNTLEIASMVPVRIGGLWGWEVRLRHGAITPSGTQRGAAGALCLRGRGIQVRQRGPLRASHAGGRRMPRPDIDVLAIHGASRTGFANGPPVTMRTRCPLGSAIVGGGLVNPRQDVYSTAPVRVDRQWAWEGHVRARQSERSGGSDTSAVAVCLRTRGIPVSVRAIGGG